MRRTLKTWASDNAMTTPSRASEDRLTDNLTWADIEAAASALTPVHDSDERVTVEVNGNAYDPLVLLARAAGVEPDRLRLSASLQLLKRLRLKSDESEGDSQVSPQGTTSTQPSTSTQSTDPENSQEHEHGIHTNQNAVDERVDEIASTAGEPATASWMRQDVTPRLAQEMQRYRGQWVAAREGTIVGYGPRLRALLAAIGDQDVSVMFVPVKGKGHEE